MAKRTTVISNGASNRTPREMVIRQDRFSSDGQLKLVISGDQYPVTNYSLFGLAISATDLGLEIGDLVKDAKLILNDAEIGEFTLELRRKEKIDEAVIGGFETISEALPVERIQRVHEIQGALYSLTERLEKTSGLPIEFKYNVLELGGKLAAIEQLAESFEKRSYPHKAARDDAWAVVISNLSKQICHELKSTVAGLEKTMTSKPEDVWKDGFNYFRDHLGRFIFQSPFTDRSYKKPRGYAGDFEMMNQIYRQDGYAQSLFGSCMEHAVQMYEEPQAVRNRITYLSGKIMNLVNSTTGKVKVLSVACGPAEEIKRAVHQLSQQELDRIEFYLLDQDEDALKYAQKNIRTAALSENKNINIRLITKDMKLVVVEGVTGEAGTSFDLIYSAGLFDYFSDPVAIRCGKTLSASLSEKGKLIIGNFNVASPNWFGMMALFDWRLILRGESDMTRLFKYDKFSLRMEAEAQQVNLFCVIERQ